MEWAVLLLFAAVAAAIIGLGRSREARGAPDLEELHARRRSLLAELRDLDDDAAAGRISPADRLEGRRALGADLRAVTEALRNLGEPVRPAPRAVTRDVDSG